MFCTNGVASAPFPPNNTRKRRADSPPLTPDPFTPTWDPLPAKRRRPNLANGFSGLSLSSEATPGPSSLPSYHESQNLEDMRKQIDDDDLFSDPVAYDRNDVTVEEVRFPRRSDSSSTNSSDTIPALRRRIPRQADEVVPPDEYIDDGVGVEDVTLSLKRRSESVDRGGPAKRAREDMDVDMGDIEEIPRKRSEWYEPEKDRIIYTSLSSSSRSASPEASDSPNQLIQPGENGFTISPSMLTRLLATQSSIPPPFPQQREMGLVLYRPLGIPPGRDVRNIVKEWQERQGDSGRFESVDDDEDSTLTDADIPVEEATEGMDVDM